MHDAATVLLATPDLLLDLHPNLPALCGPSASSQPGQEGAGHFCSHPLSEALPWTASTKACSASPATLVALQL